jgi:hypothetical protein
MNRYHVDPIDAIKHLFTSREEELSADSLFARQFFLPGELKLEHEPEGDFLQD